jgi:hypothetical protein
MRGVEESQALSQPSIAPRRSPQQGAHNRPQPLEQCCLEEVVKGSGRLGKWTQWPAEAVYDSGIGTIDLFWSAIHREPIHMQCTVVALFIDWRRTDTELKAFFSQFLRAHRGTPRVLPNPDKRGRDTDESRLRTELKALAALRLWRHCGSIEKAMSFTRKAGLASLYIKTNAIGVRPNNGLKRSLFIFLILKKTFLSRYLESKGNLWPKDFLFSTWGNRTRSGTTWADAKYPATQHRGSSQERAATHHPNPNPRSAPHGPHRCGFLRAQGSQSPLRHQPVAPLPGAR